MRSTLILLTFLPATGWAAVGEVPVQGFLTDIDDVPVEGVTVLTAQLYSEEDTTNGTLLYQDTFTVDVVSGRFDLSLGSGVNDLDLDLFQQWPDVHFVVTIGTQPPLDPVPFAHVPYAAWSANAAVASEAATLEGSSRADLEDWTRAQCLEDATEVVDVLDGQDLDIDSLVLRSTTDVTAGATGGALVIGNTSDEHIRIDGNEIGAFENGGPDTLAVNFEGDVLLGRSRVFSTEDVSMSSQGAFMIGSTGGVNVALDNNEIMARNNGARSTLYVQNDGGNVHFGSNTPDVAYVIFDQNPTMQGAVITAGMNRFEIAGSCTTGRTYVATTPFGDLFCVCLNNENVCFH